MKTEIVEDGALGRKVKEEKFKLKVVYGQKYIEAIWARDFNTLWHGLRRLMIPLYQVQRINVFLMTISSFLLLLLPFIAFPFFVLFSSTVHSFADGYYRYNYSTHVYDFLLLVDVMTIVILFITSTIQSKYILSQNSIYALGSPLAGTIIFFAFISSILDATKKNAVNWKDRKYTIKESH